MNDELTVQLRMKGSALPGVLSGLVSLNALELPAVLILDIAENINTLRKVIEEVESAVQVVVTDIQSRVRLATPSAENPQAEFDRRRIEITNKPVLVTLRTLPVEPLLDGEKKATPGAIAELMPILRNLQNVRVPKN